MVQRFIQRHRPQPGQGIQPLLIRHRQRLFQPGESWIRHQGRHPSLSRGAVPASIGIEPQPPRGWQALQQLLQQKI